MIYSTYKDYLAWLKGLEEEDPHALLKLNVASAVEQNIGLSEYDDQGYEKLCERVFQHMLDASCDIDADDLCYAIQDALDNGAFETIDDACLEAAHEQAVAMAHERY